MKKIIAFEADFAQEYFSRKMNATQEELARAQDLFSKIEKQSIYSENEDMAIIQITGPLSRSGPDFWDMLMGYGGTSYGDIIESIKKAESNDRIKKIQLQMDTPGGEVTGVDEVWTALTGCKKKKIAINNGMIASAGMWIASGCDQILAVESTSETGSIGVVISVVDWSEREKQFGVKVYDITSENAPDKRPDVSTKKGRDVLKKRVDAIENVFISRVAAGRNTTVEDVKENFGRGSMLIAEDPNGMDAADVGMIDGLIKSDYTREDNENGVYETDENSPDAVDVQNKSTPITGEKTEDTMTLKEFLAQNPDANAKYQTDLADAKTKGVEAGKAEAQLRIDATVNYIGNENYPGIETLAKEVLKGDAEVSSLKGAVVAFDMLNQKKKSDAAIEDTKDIGETTANHEVSTEKTANIKAEEDIKNAARYS